MPEDRIVTVGMDVPNFEIDTYDPVTGKFGTISLEAVRKQGKFTVLFFYPADFTFVCPTELADLGEWYEDLKKAGAEVISVSRDTKYVHLAWHNAEKLLQDIKFPMGADPTGELAQMFGVYDCTTGLALRGTFVISPEGKLVMSEINFYNVGRSASELVRKVEANAYVAQNPAQACPANWKPGKKVLTPSEKIVGHVYEEVKE